MCINSNVAQYLKKNSKREKRGKTFEPLTHTLVKTPVKVEGLTRRIRLSKKNMEDIFFQFGGQFETLTFFFLWVVFVINFLI